MTLIYSFNHIEYGSHVCAPSGEKLWEELCSSGDTEIDKIGFLIKESNFGLSVRPLTLFKTTPDTQYGSEISLPIIFAQKFGN